MSLLSAIHGPADLKRLRRDQLPQLAAEIRERLIEGCSQTGGHIGASLGVVELTIALLYEFDSPTDKILWDVGHQAYAWKLLTGEQPPRRWESWLILRSAAAGRLARGCRSARDRVPPVSGPREHGSGGASAAELSRRRAQRGAG